MSNAKYVDFINMSLSMVAGKVGSQRTNVTVSVKVSGNGMNRMTTFVPVLTC